MEPTRLGVNINLVARKTPTQILKANAGKFVELGYDFGIRSEGVVLGRAGSSITLFDAGIIRSEFRGMTVRDSSDSMEKLLAVIYAIPEFGWKLAEEKIFIDMDLVFEFSNGAPVDTLRSICEETNLNRIIRGANLPLRAVGVRLFFEKLDSEEDLSVRIEPLARDPQNAYFLHVSHIRRATAIQLTTHLAYAQQLADKVAHNLKSIEVSSHAK